MTHHAGALPLVVAVVKAVRRARWLPLLLLVGCATLGPGPAGVDGSIEWPGIALRLARMDQGSPCVYSAPLARTVRGERCGAFVPAGGAEGRAAARHVRRDGAVHLPAPYAPRVRDLPRAVDHPSRRPPSPPPAIEPGLRPRGGQLLRDPD